MIPSNVKNLCLLQKHQVKSHSVIAAKDNITANKTDDSIKCEKLMLTTLDVEKGQPPVLPTQQQKHCNQG